MAKRGTRPRRKITEKTDRMIILISTEEKQILQARASARSLSLSSWSRDRLLEAARAEARAEADHG